MMVMASEVIIDRRRLRRKLFFWRVVTFLTLVGLILALGWFTGATDYLVEQKQDHIARVEINGTITHDQRLIDLLGDLKQRDNVKAVILSVSSPGGLAVGGEAIYKAIRDLAKNKPVVSSIGALAASAGYMIVSASDYIVAYRSSIVGSIGVIFQYVDASQILKKIGVEVNEIKSSPLKAEPSPFHTASEAAKEMINKVVRDSYDWFVELVAKRRNMSKVDALKLSDGSVFSGMQGVENGLIDAIGDEETVRNWLVKEKNIEENLQIIDWKPERLEERIFSNLFGVVWLFKQFGLNIDPETASVLSERLQNPLLLNGLVSMWRGAAN